MFSFYKLHCLWNDFFIIYQHLTKKKDQSDFAVKSWKTQSHNNVLVTKTLDCLAQKSDKASVEKKKKTHEIKRIESERAQAIALEIAANIDSMGSEKPKPG